MALEEVYEIFTDSREETVLWLSEEIAGVRSGRVTPDLVDKVPVEYYGSRTPLNGLATVSNSDARTLVVAPWDHGASDAIVKALGEANLGAQPNLEEDVIRLSFPSLTEEIREQTVKTLHQKAEEARVKLRQSRDEALKLLKEEKESSDLTEDDFYDGKQKLDDMIAETNQEIDQLIAKKEEDVRVV